MSEINDIPNNVQQNAAYNKIGGLLIFFVVKIIYAVVTLLLQIKNMVVIILSGTYSKYISLLLANEVSAFQSDFFSQLIVIALLFVAYIILAILLFKKKSIFPKMMIAVLCFDALYGIIRIYYNTIHSVQASANEISHYIGYVAGILIVVGIQVLYLIRSKRVKDTFVK